MAHPKWTEEKAKETINWAEPVSILIGLSRDKQFYFHWFIRVLIRFFFSAEEPQSAPFMLAGKLKYGKDEQVRINCTSFSAFPATNLTWFINDKQVSCPMAMCLEYNDSASLAHSNSTRVKWMPLGIDSNCASAYQSSYQ